MAEFLTTRGTALQVENIIKNAKERVVLISPYVRFPETLLQNLKDADRRKVKIILVYGKKEELDPDEQSKLQQLSNLSLLFLKNLHAKCMFNEEFMVITSMNLYDSSEQSNMEMGILISRKDDEHVFSAAFKEAKLIIDSSTKGASKSQISEHKSDYRTGNRQEGHCIRCGREIPNDPTRPYCYDCYDEWAEWENPEYKESYCHTCGRSEPTTMSKPQCRSCFKSQR